MLALLTDEHISHVVAEQVRLKRGDIRIESMLAWRQGALRNTPDDLVLAAAQEDGLTLITYDQKTIPPILVDLAACGGHHTGVVFADRNTIPSGNIGRLVQAVIGLYDRYQDLDWTDVVMFLSPAT
jgi:hypothetical protein